MVRIAKIKYFNIYSDHKGNYIIHNTHKEFNKGHTHINNYHTAKYITNISIIVLLDHVLYLSKENLIVSPI